ncbi:dipeptidase PepE [Aquimarina sp. AD10]|uniref:dipeptidase PepE n=1 Tax=Aquimarina sp. AD10 TaxID=1714849 RepID=UPI000E55035D|nr:dipeptidase PepE [Aquimarina sp. AD10]AXT60796.1 dipeptidase PepE [Aquimarina sp. AD10]RKM98504.1 dipeptidase PepE [Aquimarina sp. AD10]
MRNCIIASTSTIHGSQPLAYLKDALIELYSDVDEILFIPYARPGGISHDEYTIGINNIFKKINKKIVSIHMFKSTQDAFNNVQGIYTGGGNTFLLVDQLYRNNVITPLKEAILSGVPYLGTSAGSNICGLTMQTTNDMPITYPPNFKTLGIFPFNINAHYLDPDPNSTHKGETRETRIKEFHNLNSQPVVGLREGSWLRIRDEEITLEGDLSARIFEQNKAPYELDSGNSLSTLN